MAIVKYSGVVGGLILGIALFSSGRSFGYTLAENAGDSHAFPYEDAANRELDHESYFSLPKFDPSLGTLTGVTYSWSAETGGTYVAYSSWVYAEFDAFVDVGTVENGDASPWDYVANDGHYYDSEWADSSNYSGAADESDHLSDFIASSPSDTVNVSLRTTEIVHGDVDVGGAGSFSIGMTYTYTPGSPLMPAVQTPEPASLGLLCSGMGILLRRRRCG